MRATTLIRTSLAAALLAGAALTSACAVEDDGADDAFAEEAELDADAVGTVEKAGTSLRVFFLHCNGVSPWFEANMSGGSGSIYELYMSTSQNGPWSRIHRGGAFDTWAVTGARYYKARNCTS